MTRILARRKTRDEAAESVDVDRDSFQPPAANKKKSWRWKKPKEAAQPELNIAAALPSVENFRTSLIMPNLSTRFSMLKEQDDPYSMLGKANDDSVLAPRRRSRLMDFGFNAVHLSDIAETSSIISSRVESTRAPSSRLEEGSARNASYSYGERSVEDEQAAYTGSIMSRARPGEGNTLFGGRQKIYKIPVGDSGAVSNLGGIESRGMRGRALYEDDVCMSAFQKYREQEKLEKLRQQEASTTTQQPLEKEPDLDFLSDPFDSPSFSYNERRETTSSINSGPSMMATSTAPTSVAGSSPLLPPSIPSQPTPPLGVERTRSRKLYEQGLDQHLLEQQSANLTRLTSLQRNTSVAAPYRSQSATNMHDRFERSALNSSRVVTSQSQPDQTPSSNSSSHRPSIEQPSSFPTRSSSYKNDINEGKVALWQCLDPIDRGMATAMGTFNKPQKFSEEQFLQRQMSLLQQQPKNRSNSNPPKSMTREQTLEEDDEEHDARPKTATTNSDRSWSQSSRKNESTTFTVARKPVPAPAPNTVGESGKQMDVTAPVNDTPSPSRSSDKESDDESARSSPIEKAIEKSQQNSMSSARVAPSSTRNAPPPPIFTHPAMRSPTSPNWQSRKTKRRAWSPDELKAATDGLAREQAANEQTDETDYLGSNLTPSLDENADLKGLVREHLRHPSNSSSVYPLQTPASKSEFDFRAPSVYSPLYPEEDVNDLSNRPDVSDIRYVPQPPSPGPVNYQEVAPHNPTDSEPLQSIHEVSASLPEPEPTQLRVEIPPTPESTPSEAEASPSPLEPESISTESEVLPSQTVSSLPSHVTSDWEQELNSQHKRGESSETTHERIAFASELAQRQKAIQENLKVKVGGTPSPTTSSKNVFESGLRPFGMLRNKNSYDTLPTGRDSPKPWSTSSERSSSKTRGNREAVTSPPPMGRTLHSRMPGTFEDGPAFLEYSRAPHPSIDHARPSLEAGMPRQSSNSTAYSRAPPSQSQSSPPGSSRTSVSKRRSASDASAPVSISEVPTQRKESSSIPRPSLETSRVRSDSCVSKISVTASSPSKAQQSRSVMSGLSKLSTSSPTKKSMNKKMSEPYSTSSTPPLSSASTPVLVSGALSTESTNTQGSAKDQDQNVMSTGFFFPNNDKAPTPEPPKPRPRARKGTISKHDISEPTLIAATSEVDTVDLPPGASLQNGLRDDFDVVLFGSSGSAPAPTIPTGDKPRKGGFLSSLARREKSERDEFTSRPEDEPEPKRFRIKRMDTDHAKGLKAMHKTFMAEESGTEVGTAMFL